MSDILSWWGNAAVNTYNAAVNTNKTCPNGMKFPIEWLDVDCKNPPVIVCPDSHISTTGRVGCGKVNVTLWQSLGGTIRC